MLRFTSSRIMKMIVLTLLAFSTIGANIAEIKTSPAAYCGKLSSYTRWYWAGYPKPTLFVWKGGGGKPNPNWVIVSYNNQTVANADNGIITNSPQVDLGNGWVGYFISTRWYLAHPEWDDDWRWWVSGCIQ